MAEAEDIVRKFRKFAAKSRDAYSEMYSRIREDRAFMSGEGQWTKDDDEFIATTRNRITCNVLSNQIWSAGNKYSTFPYTWYTGDAEIDAEIDDFFGEDSNRFATDEACIDNLAFGLGVMALGTDTTPSGENVPVVYSITDPERIFLDGDSTELDYSDAMETALVDYRSPDWIRVHMGEEYLPDRKSKPVFTGAFSKNGLVPIITYYYLETDGCHVATLINDKYVEDPENIDSVLPIKRIPVFPVFGERSWTADDKVIYRGLIAKGKTVQRIVNYAMTQMMDRLALSPKPQFRGYMESFKGYSSYYKKAGTGINPILPAQRLANDKKTVLPMPEVFQPNIQFGDLQGIITGTMDMLTSITGVDSKGLADTENEITATAVMYTSQVFANNIKHYFNHLRTSFKALGDCVMVLMGHPGQKINVAQGPEAYMQNQVARQELTALMGVVEPNQKPALVNAILKTHPDNEILAQLYVDLNKMQAPTAMEEQAMQTMQQMKEALDAKDEEIMRLSKELEDFQIQAKNDDKSQVFELEKMRLEHQYGIEDRILEAQLNQGADADKAAIEAERARVQLEAAAQKAAIDAESGRMKLANQAATQQMAMEGKRMQMGLNLASKLFGGKDETVAGE